MHWDVQSKVNVAISIRIDGILFVWLKWIGIFLLIITTKTYNGFTPCGFNCILICMFRDITI